MKKVICLISLSAMTLFSGCADSENQIPTLHTFSQESPKASSENKVELSENQASVFMEKIKNLSDEELLYTYVNGLEVALTGKNELFFKNPDEFPQIPSICFFSIPWKAQNMKSTKGCGTAKRIICSIYL